MKCPSTSRGGESMLLAFVAGHVRGEPGAEVTAHVRNCQTCAGYVSSQKAVWDLLDGFEVPPVTPDFDRRFHALADDSETLPARFARALYSWLTRPSIPLAAATMLVVLGAALGIPKTSHTPGRTPPGAIVTPINVTPIDAEQLNKTFEDLQLLQQLDVKDEASGPSKAM